MDTKLILANISRTLARIGSIIVILCGVPFLLFVGLQLLSGESANATIFLSLIVLVAMFVGLITAWWKEGLGAGITSVSVVASFLLSGASLPGVGREQGFSILAGPINLLFALLFPGYHPEVSPSAKMVPLISWILLIVPVLLFLASWLLRREVRKIESPERIPAGKETRTN